MYLIIRKKMLAETKHKLTMDSLFEQIREGELKELPLVVKADVQGSVEALCSSLEKLSNDEENMMKTLLESENFKPKPSANDKSVFDKIRDFFS